MVFSGNLLEARVNLSKEIELKNARHIVLSHLYIEPSSRGYREHQFLVDVVQESYLLKFSAILKSEHENFAMRLQNAIMAGTWQPSGRGL